MPPTLVQLSDTAGQVLETGQQYVWIRQHWEDAWLFVPYLRPLEVVWSTAPTMPVATLEWVYGDLKQNDLFDFTLYDKLRGVSRWYVRIVCETMRDPAAPASWLYRIWHGVLELEADEDLGSRIESVPSIRGAKDINVATGRQEWTCYGLEKLLADHVVNGVWWYDDASASEEFNIVPAVFNRRGIGNRTAIPHGTAPREYFLFEPDLDLAEKWTSGAIVQYLLHKQTPIDRLGGLKVPFQFPSAHVIPLWDEPELDPEDQTTYSLIDRLINRRRLITWWLTVDEGTTPHTVQLQTATLTPTDVTINLPLATPIPANAQQKILATEFSQLASVSVQASDIGQYDQVIARGSRRQSIGSFTFNGELEAGWEASDEADYEAGASGAIDYPTLTAEQQAKRNAAVRASPKLRKVYSFFRIPQDWDLMVRDGAGVTHPLFVQALGGPAPQKQYYPEMFVQRSLPLLADVDYSGGAIAARSYQSDEAKPDRERLGPLAFIARPDTLKWQPGEDFAVDTELVDAADNPQFSVSLEVREESHGFYVRVIGEPQHALATLDFSGLAIDPAVGSFDFAQHLVVTLAVADGRYVEGRWPPVEPPGDALRHKIIDCGDQFEYIHVPPGTVVGCDKDGNLLRSEGGDIERPTDCLKRLVAIAQVAAAWYCRSHFSVTVETQWLATNLTLGDLITDLQPIGPALSYSNGHFRTVNAPVSEIRIVFDKASGETPPPPTMTIRTFCGELDPLQTLPPPRTPPTILGGYVPGGGTLPGTAPVPPANTLSQGRTP